MRGLMVAACVICLAGGSAEAGERGATRLSVGDPLPLAGSLRSGVRRYLRYTVRDGRREAVDIWSREVAFERRDGREAVRVSQRWDRVSSPAYTRLQESWFERGTFRPLTHVSRLERDGLKTVAGYRFLHDRVVALEKLADNAKPGFSQAFPEPAFNFETDLEQFEQLPWGHGYSVSVPFYDPGLEPPARYTFRTVGSQRIDGAGGTPIDCWIVSADYNTGRVVKRFWFAKRSHVMMHEEAEQGGVVYVKTLLGAEA